MTKSDEIQATFLPVVQIRLSKRSGAEAPALAAPILEHQTPTFGGLGQFFHGNNNNKLQTQPCGADSGETSARSPGDGRSRINAWKRVVS